MKKSKDLNIFRLGSKDDATEVKKDKFFEGLNWLAVEKREFAGPVKPKIVGGFTDVENFAAGNFGQ
jgi:hypothetical protein